MSTKKGGPRRTAPPRGGGGPPRKKKKSNALPMVLALTVLALLGCLTWLGAYMADKYVPKPPPTQAELAAVKRPVVEEKFQTKPLKRPGILVMAPDQIYYPKAEDVLGKPIEPVVNGLLERGVATIFADGKFRPNDPIPRAEFVLWCYNAMMQQAVKGTDPFVTPKKPLHTVEAVGDEFEDVDGDHWAVQLLATLKAAHYFGEKTPTKFRPDEPLRREEWALHASLWCGTREDLLNMNKAVNDTKLAVAMRKLDYTDAAAIKGLYKPYVWFIVSDDKRKLWMDTTFEPPINPKPWEPHKAVTRGEAATFIGGFFEEMGRSFL